MVTLAPMALQSATSDATSDPAGVEVLLAALAAAAACGVTRLADITGLDRVGVPVFHAVRPRSRAHAVHQGKGLTPLAAKIGALMEAVESARAEAFEAPGRLAAFADLPAGHRAAALADFASDRANPVGPDEPIVWVEAERLADGRPMHVPFDAVSLDFVRPWDRRLDHTSNGLGARLDDEGAALKGLLEVLEQDATAVWRGRPLTERALSAVDRGSIPYPWFGDLCERLRAADIALALHSLPTAIALPAFHAEVFARKAPGPTARSNGWACAPRAEDALLGAVLEALQSRLSAIVATRDDLLHERSRGLRAGEAPPLPPHLAPLDWAALSRDRPDAAALTPQRIAEELARAGYPDAAVVGLSAPGDRVRVMKVFAPGLAANRRTRRPPALGAAA